MQVDKGASISTGAGFPCEQPSGCQAGSISADPCPTSAGVGQAWRCQRGVTGWGGQIWHRGSVNEVISWGMERLRVESLIKPAKLTGRLATALFPLSILHTEGNFPPLPAHTQINK